MDPLGPIDVVVMYYDGSENKVKHIAGLDPSLLRSRDPLDFGLNETDDVNYVAYAHDTAGIVVIDTFTGIEYRR